MKRLKIILLVIGSFGLMSTQASAQDQFKGQNELTIQAGGLILEGDSPYTNPGLIGGRYGRYLSEPLAVEVSLLSGHMGRVDRTDRVNILIPSAHMLYHFGSTNVRPFVQAGLGFLKYMPDSQSASTHFSPQLGTGVKWHFSRDFLVRAETAYVFDTAAGEGKNNLNLLVGLGWRFRNLFGCPQSSTPCDADQDGVTDDKDKCPNTPKGTKVDETGCPIIAQEEVERRWVLRDIRFAFNSTQFDTRSRIHLDEVAAVLTAQEKSKVEIQGHTDSRGPKSYNQLLSERRADMCKLYLVKKGVSADRITTIGHGERQPIESNATPEGRAANRRVEFKIIP